MRRHLPRRRIEVGAEQLFYYRPTARESITELAGGQLQPISQKFDWLFHGGPVAVAVEVKTRARAGFQLGQLKHYHRVLDRDDELKHIPNRGSWCLAREMPARDDLINERRRKHFLGVILSVAQTIDQRTSAASVKRSCTGGAVVTAINPFCQQPGSGRWASTWESQY